jgi:putative SOS response-associated peptidase YedK
MCGRFTLHGPGDELKAYFEVDGLDDLPDRYNIAPTQNVLALRLEEGEQRFAELSWGLVPSWAKDRNIANKLINARSETAAEKPSFRTAMRQRRCIIPASGYYEWQKVGKEKQPYYIHHSVAPFLAFAGLWERWVDGDGAVLESCTILTTGARTSMAWLHHRMPVILEPESFKAWLSGEVERKVFEPNEGVSLKSHAVSQRVNGVAHDDAQCIEECAPVVAGNLELF